MSTETENSPLEDMIDGYFGNNNSSPAPVLHSSVESLIGESDDPLINGLASMPELKSSSVNQASLNMHIEDFISQINSDPDLKGLVMNISTIRPEGSLNLVTTLSIGASCEDLQTVTNEFSEQGG